MFRGKLRIFTKISVSPILEAHIQTLRNNQTKKISYWDIFLFFLFPPLASSFLVYVGFELNDSMAGVLTTAFSIFSALLFNLLLLVYDITCKENIETKSKLEEDEFSNIGEKQNQLRLLLLKETFANISYSILVAILTVILLLFYFLKIDENNIFEFDFKSIETFLDISIYSLAIQFILTILMILKRVHTLLTLAFNVGGED